MPHAPTIASNRMTVHEPMTLATDYILAIASSIFAMRLWRVHRLWALAFLFTACGSFFGGTSHGFAPVLERVARVALWKATVFSIGLASFFLLLGIARRRPPGRWNVLVPFAVIKLVIYLSWMITHDGFVWVIADYGLTLLIVGALVLMPRDRDTLWILDSIALSIVGALIQMSRVSLHTHFNYNDLYHVIQVVALWFLYRGGLLMSDVMNRSTERPTNPPR